MSTRIAIIGLGYVGFPLAVEFVNLFWISIPIKNNTF